MTAAEAELRLTCVSVRILRCFDGKVKVWSVDTFSCVATQNEATSSIYAVQSIPRGTGIGEGFVATGASRSIYYYRETTGE